MKVILLGNAGAGKSTLAKKLIAQQPAPCLSLDEVAFQGGTERRALQDSLADVKRFIANNDHWIIEGCYADILEPISLSRYCRIVRRSSSSILGLRPALPTANQGPGSLRSLAPVKHRTKIWPT